MHWLVCVPSEMDTKHSKTTKDTRGDTNEDGTRVGLRTVQRELPRRLWSQMDILNVILCIPLHGKAFVITTPYARHFYNLVPWRIMIYTRTPV